MYSQWHKRIYKRNAIQLLCRATSIELIIFLFIFILSITLIMFFFIKVICIYTVFNTHTPILAYKSYTPTRQYNT